ncbi:MAG TPA: caspase family protein [Pirellulales bacterium]|nr:caspase family protein [Pirellulales bacterium]
MIGLLTMVWASSEWRALYGQTSEGESPKGRQWAALVGIEKYERANPLQFTINDVRRAGETLRTRGGYDPECILEITDDAADPRRQPKREVIMAGLAAWLKKPTKDDRIVVYFSGHGFRADDGTMYLAPIDVDPANPAATGIPVAWFRDQIAACQAGFKLLVLDACHAGSEKGEGDANLDEKDLNIFRELQKVVTLASSTADQKSQIWSEKEQSLFSYWLNEGLKGHADDDADGSVDIDELNKYVYRNVTHTSKVRFDRKQTPVRIIHSATPGTPVVLRLVPQRLNQVLADMAQQLGDTIEEKKFAKVGVLEFTNETNVGERLSATYGTLGKHCAEHLERRLVQQAQGRFAVIDQRNLERAISQEQFALADLGSGEALKALAAKAEGMPVIALGTLGERTGRIVNLRCKLKRTDNNELATSVGGAVQLTESEWAMTRSVVVKPNDRRPELPSGDEAPRPLADQVIDRLDERSDGAHPLADPKCPFRVSLKFNGKERKGVFKGNEYFVGVRKGDVFEIWVENKTGQKVMMRLLVDGRNTLPEAEKPTDVEPTPDGAPPPAAKGLLTEVVCPHVNLDEARHWVLDPVAARTNIWAVRGFVSKTGEEGELGRFTVVDADDTLGQRTRFDKEAGIITAAFYSPTATARGNLVVVGGEKKSEYLKEAKRGETCGNLLESIQIRYVNADALEAPGK